MIHTCIPPEGESNDAYRQQQSDTEGAGVHRPPAVVVMSMPRRPSDAIRKLCSEKQSQKRTTILSLGDAAANGNAQDQTEKSPAATSAAIPRLFCPSVSSASVPPSDEVPARQDEVVINENLSRRPWPHAP